MDTQDIRNILEKFIPFKYNYTICIVANVNDTVQDEETFISHTNFSEFFTKAEFATIASTITELFGYVRIFYSETEFMHYVFDNINHIYNNNIIIFNFTRDGDYEGKKSLIPAFCDFYKLKYISSNAFVISLLRNKFVYTKYLSTFDIPVPFTTCSNLMDNTMFSEIKNKKIIIKNIYESASIGIDKNNVISVTNYNTLISMIKKCHFKMNSNNLLIQEYIPGKECEVFVIRQGDNFYAFTPIMINISSSSIITSAISNEYDYTFSPLSQEYTLNICKSIQKTSEKAAKLLNIKNYARFDYRIDANGEFYLIDIAGSPYLTRHSSIEYLFTKLLNLEYSDIFLLITAITAENYSHDVNCKSDNSKPLEV